MAVKLSALVAVKLWALRLPTLRLLVPVGVLLLLLLLATCPWACPAVLTSDAGPTFHPCTRLQVRHEA